MVLFSRIFRPFFLNMMKDFLELQSIISNFNDVITTRCEVPCSDSVIEHGGVADHPCQTNIIESKL